MELIFDTIDAANHILYQIDDIIDDFGVMSVYDLNELIGGPLRHSDTKHGWTSMKGMFVKNGQYSFVLKLPEPVFFNVDPDTEITEMNKPDPSDNVNHPSHYMSKSGIETIQVIDAFTDGLIGTEAVCTGNALKYLCRWKHKNGVEDLKKAVWYLNHLIEKIEKEND